MTNALSATNAPAQQPQKLNPLKQKAATASDAPVDKFCSCTDQHPSPLAQAARFGRGVVGAFTGAAIEGAGAVGYVIAKTPAKVAGLYEGVDDGNILTTAFWGAATTAFVPLYVAGLAVGEVLGGLIGGTMEGGQAAYDDGLKAAVKQAVSDNHDNWQDSGGV